MLPISVAVNGKPLGNSSKETVRQYESGGLSLRAETVWYVSEDDEGTQRLYLYPAPGGGLTIEVEYVYRPVPFDTSNLNAEPTEIPEEFHTKPLYYVNARYYETVEDNPELAARNEQLFDQAVSDLRRHSIQQRSASGPFQVPIVGWTA